MTGGTGFVTRGYLPCGLGYLLLGGVCLVIWGTSDQCCTGEQCSGLVKREYNKPTCGLIHTKCMEGS